jgi:neprilysin
MTRYKQTDFADEETSSIGSIHLNEVRTSPNMHIRFANRVNLILCTFHASVDKFPISISNQNMFPSLWDRRSKLEKYLLIIILVLFIMCIMLVIVSLKEAETETRILHVKQHPYMGEFIDDDDAKIIKNFVKQTSRFLFRNAMLR